MRVYNLFYFRVLMRHMRACAMFMRFVYYIVVADFSMDIASARIGDARTQLLLVVVFASVCCCS